jgi:hypothetical protein
MARQSLVWTALPNGYTADGSSLRLSVFLAPRLNPEADPTRLDTFPEWVDWPTTLQQAKLKISCNGATVTVAADGSGSKNVVDGRLGVADSATWAALFTPALFVKPYQFQDLSNHSITSFNATAMANMVQVLYANLAGRASDSLVPIEGFIDRAQPWAALVQAVESIDNQSDDTGLLGSPSTPPVTLLRSFTNFHTPLSTPTTHSGPRQDDKRITATWQEYQQQPLPKPTDLTSQLDFHQIVSSMGSYPKLMRLLGLVVDVLLDPTAFPPGNNVALSVSVNFPRHKLTKHSFGKPVTLTLLSATKFKAVSDPAATYPTKDGLLQIDPARFSLLQMDVDGAAMKMMNFARTVIQSLQVGATVDPVTRKTNDVGVPSLRNAGLMLVQVGRGDWLSTRFQQNAKNNSSLENQMSGSSSSSSSSGPLQLHAEDVLRGYRFDIWDATAGVWQSLCRRTAHYELGSAPVVVDVTPEEESTIRLAATTSADPASNTDVVSLHEALMTWNGWSLAARPPGRSIRPDDSIDKSQDQSEADVPPGLPFLSRFKPVAGSLPRLRFGRSYWLRARAVDLAGNSLDYQPSDFGSENATALAVPYLRFDPLASPILALVSQNGNVEAPGPGESVQRMAIRSYNDSPADNAIPTAEQAHRGAVPPRVSARDAEQHGMLDKNGRVDASTFTMLAVDRDRDGHDPLSVVREVVLQTQGPLDPSPVPTTFAVYEIGRAMTYLPDPLAAEVAVRVFNHPNIDPATIITIPLYPNGAWPDTQPFVVQVYEDASAAPSFDVGSAMLRMPLPKAVRAVVRMSMKLSDAALSKMGVYAWLDAATRAAQAQRARDGQHWMLTPWLELEVVHATQRPLIRPDIQSVSILLRSPGETNARPVIVAQCSIASTDRVDVHSTSHEPVDDGAAPGDQARNDLAFSLKITDATTYATVLDGNTDGGIPDVSVAGSDLVATNSPPDALTNGLLTAKAHEFHDTRYRRVTYWLNATSRFREFLPTSLLTVPGPSGPVPTEQNIGVTGADGVTWILSSAAPPAPHVLYVLPTFSWQRNQDGVGDSVSERRGGLRVYLDRPWNVSGYGEMLAVVLPPAGFSGNPDTDPSGHPLKNYVTQWGADPVWDSDIVPGIAPQPSDFSLARTSPDPTGAWLPPGAPQTEADQPAGPFKVTGLAPQGVTVNDVQIDVAPHDVTWSDDRQLWFCDIGLNSGAAYFPFIRLALARYQPSSIDGTYLSNIVLADFVALTPGRWLAIATTGDPRTKQVTVTGHTYRTSSGWQEAAGKPGAAPVALTSTVEVWVEQLDPRLGEDFGWLRLDAATVIPGTVLAPGADPSEVLWSGKVTIPADLSTTWPCRLVVAEYEEYMVDDGLPFQQPSSRKNRRLVFVEHHRLEM